MRWKESEAEVEVGGGKDGEGFDEDVRGGLVACEVWVELVSEGLHLLAQSTLLL